MDWLFQVYIAIALSSNLLIIYLRVTREGLPAYTRDESWHECPYKTLLLIPSLLWYIEAMSGRSSTQLYYRGTKGEYSASWLHWLPHALVRGICSTRAKNEKQNL